MKLEWSIIKCVSLRPVHFLYHTDIAVLSSGRYEYQSDIVSVSYFEEWNVRKGLINCYNSKSEMRLVVVNFQCHCRKFIHNQFCSGVTSFLNFNKKFCHAADIAPTPCYFVPTLAHTVIVITWALNPGSRHCWMEVLVVDCLYWRF